MQGPKFKTESPKSYLEDPELVTRRLANFDTFLRLRWGAELPKGKGLTLLPLCASESHFRGFNKRLVELLALCRERVSRSFLRDAKATVEKLYGEGEFPISLLKEELGRPNRQVPILARPDVVIDHHGNTRILESNMGPGFAGLFWCEQLFGFYHSEPKLKAWVGKNHLKMPAPHQGIAKLSKSLKIQRLAIIDPGSRTCFHKQWRNM